VPSFIYLNLLIRLLASSHGFLTNISVLQNVRSTRVTSICISCYWQRIIESFLWIDNDHLTETLSMFATFSGALDTSYYAAFPSNCFLNVRLSSQTRSDSYIHSHVHSLTLLCTVWRIDTCVSNGRNSRIWFRCVQPLYISEWVHKKRESFDC
jgi:hypothetical protein